MYGVRHLMLLVGLSVAWLRWQFVVKASVTFKEFYLRHVVISRLLLIKFAIGT